MEPRDVFISHTEEDGPTARTLAAELRALDRTTWIYEEDGVAGISYLTQIHAAIESCRTFVLLASPRSVKAHQVVREVEQAHEREKVIITARVGMSHQQFIASNPILTMACGTAVTLAVEDGKLADAAKRIASAVTFSESQAEARPTRPTPMQTSGTAKSLPLSSESDDQKPAVAPKPRAPTPLIARAEQPGSVAAEVLGVTPRLWTSIWIGVVGQMIWAAAVAFDMVSFILLERRLFPQSELDVSHVIAPALPVVVIAAGLGLCWSLVQWRRSPGTRRIQSGPYLLLVVTAVFVLATHGFLVTAIYPDRNVMTNWVFLPGLSPYFMIFTATCLALVWNGLRMLQARAS